MKSRPAKEWLSPETSSLIKERRSLKPTRMTNDANKNQYNYLCREVERQSRLDKKYLTDMCRQIDKAHMQKKTGKCMNV